MTGVQDIHTHHAPSVPGRAIINQLPFQFLPEPGHYYSVGIHPWEATDRSDWPEEDEEWIVRMLMHPRVLAVGEAGLDRTRPGFETQQAVCFRRQVIWADRVNKPLLIHAVHAMNEIIQLKKALHPRNPWIVHGFRGNPETALQYLRHGIGLSFGFAYRPETLRAVPPECLFLETDLCATDIEALYRRVAADLGREYETLFRQVRQNIDKTFFRPAIVAG